MESNWPSLMKVGAFRRARRPIDGRGPRGGTSVQRVAVQIQSERGSTPVNEAPGARSRGSEAARCGPSGASMELQRHHNPGRCWACDDRPYAVVDLTIEWRLRAPAFG